ncbi:MAG TPA: DUF1697 domain-containing protein [Bacteroidota bacterium]|jgi:uncharacterized protein (DUF1697 family)|nr:DUF1697 domain-containing protein [Bacteroidota bacterium]
MIYVALLRGINVGGQRSIKMAGLSTLFESLNFQNVRTYVQSGNVVFESRLKDAAAIAGNIEKKITRTYGFDVKVILRTIVEFENIVSHNPFTSERTIEIDKLHVTFLQGLPDKQSVSTLDIKKEINERYIVQGREIYLYCPNGYGRTKLNNGAFERNLKLPATTRNWKTTNKLLEISRTGPFVKK